MASLWRLHQWLVESWQRWGLLTIAAIMVALSIGGDLLYFHFDLRALHWFNYLFVWLAVHQLGFAWLDGRFTTKRSAFSLCVLRGH